MRRKPKLGIGLIGAGFRGKAHVFGFTAAPRLFDLPYDIELKMVAEQTPELAVQARDALGFEIGTYDWRNLISDPDIDVIYITSPNVLHKEMALSAIAAGKHVYCEKPLAPTAKDALEMTLAAEAAGVKTQVGFIYLCNPMLAYAKAMIASGELGEIRSYRGVHAEDYMADKKGVHSFRHDLAGGGAFADIGSHALATAEYLLGPIDRVMGNCVTVIGERPDGEGGMKKVEVDDLGRSFVRFSSGATGSVEASWIAMGRKKQHDFEVYGTRGALCFSQERFNELHFYCDDEKPGLRGFRRVEATSHHAFYGRSCVPPGHQLGFNDLKAIEVAGFIEAIAGLRPEPFNFRAGLGIQRLVELIHLSSIQEKWLHVTS